MGAQKNAGPSQESAEFADMKAAQFFCDGKSAEGSGF
jgi:hypothetical protein